VESTGSLFIFCFVVGNGGGKLFQLHLFLILDQSFNQKFSYRQRRPGSSSEKMDQWNTRNDYAQSFVAATTNMVPSNSLHSFPPRSSTRLQNSALEPRFLFFFFL
jgi:hypothetical protein